MIRSTIALALLTAACGGGGTAGVDAAPGAIDAHATIDAAPGPPDAAPTPYGCLGQPLPTTAPATITLSGTTVQVSGSSTAPLAGVSVDAFVGASATAAASTTSSGTGTYSVGVSTGGAPVDAYLRAQKSGELDMYLYAAVPLAKDGPNATLVLVKQSDFDFLAIGAGVTQSGSKGFVTVIVIDCLGNAVSGATVTATPSSGTTIRYLAGGQPSKTAVSTDASGTAMIFNAPTASVEVGAKVGGMTLRAHAITARAGAITATVVQP